MQNGLLQLLSSICIDDIFQGGEEEASAADLFQMGEGDAITAYPFESMPRQ